MIVVRAVLGVLLLAGCAPEGVRPSSSRPAPVAPALADEPLRVVVVSDLNGEHGDTRYGEPVHRAVARVVELAPDITYEYVAERTGATLARIEDDPRPKKR